MKVNKKLCDKCGTLKVIWKNHLGSRYCQACWKLELPKSSRSNKPTARQKPIPRVSPRRAQQEKTYFLTRKEFIKKYPVCKAALPGVCNGPVCDIHHMKGRIGDLLLDQTYWLPVCRACHYWIEMRPEAAKELGFSINRLSNDNNT